MAWSWESNGVCSASDWPISQQGRPLPPPLPFCPSPFLKERGSSNLVSSSPGPRLSGPRDLNNIPTGWFPRWAVFIDFTFSHLITFRGLKTRSLYSVSWNLGQLIIWDLVAFPKQKATSCGPQFFAWGYSIYKLDDYSTNHNNEPFSKIRQSTFWNLLGRFLITHVWGLKTRHFLAKPLSL